MSGLILLSARLDFEIEMTFLLPGLTDMPVDSVHSRIERFVQKRAVWGPSEWPTIIRSARINPMPYETELLTQDHVLDWASVQIFAPKMRTEDNDKLEWAKIRALRAKNGKGSLRYSCTGEWKDCVIPR